ncbi:MAG TPA: hypothetical protein VD887_02815 [Allosphingosinicella sp.]|nr:hypothetical protein [Allosphingosinicella sp.]
MTSDDRTAGGLGSPPDPEIHGAAPEADPVDDAADAAPGGGGASGRADAGSPGGMGGVRGGVANPDHRPNGGVSPIRNDSED